MFGNYVDRVGRVVLGLGVGVRVVGRMGTG